jgi:hypothetical protein
MITHPQTLDVMTPNRSRHPHRHRLRDFRQPSAPGAINPIAASVDVRADPWIGADIAGKGIANPIGKSGPGDARALVTAASPDLAPWRICRLLPRRASRSIVTRRADERPAQI